uniref:Uncharacterized protein n=1 Tax=Romanomermis culicivorax TaxID=13658 RepID=A0A915KIV0_ROMCU
MPNSLQSVAQQGKNPDLKDVMEQMQTLRQSQCERIANAIADCDKEILLQKLTNSPINKIEKEHVVPGHTRHSG